MWFHSVSHLVCTFPYHTLVNKPWLRTLDVASINEELRSKREAFLNMDLAARRKYQELSVAERAKLAPEVFVSVCVVGPTCLLVLLTPCQLRLDVSLLEMCMCAGTKLSGFLWLTQ